ncbi:uncharacterized protein LOC135924763 [Gordionus sp. m RMFG-2023]|uniref:uncharacterized protein LOC135924763 n=1 Tax=Gordionus sp. m RMFG-2023 TaxID=3053472 RepID=UPI0031FD85DF
MGGLARLSNNDKKFLEEYCIIMEPIATSLTILESEEKMHLGCLTPTITIVIIKLNKLSGLKYGQPLIDAVLNGINKRFQHIYEDQYLLSAIIHPIFKLQWPWIKLPQNEPLKNKLIALWKKGIETPRIDNERTVNSEISFFLTRKKRADWRIITELNFLKQWIKH